MMGSRWDPIVVCGAVAQWSEQGTHNPWVVGSIPTRPTSAIVRPVAHSSANIEPGDRVHCAPIRCHPIQQRRPELTARDRIEPGQQRLSRRLVALRSGHIAQDLWDARLGPRCSASASASTELWSGRHACVVDEHPCPVTWLVRRRAGCTFPGRRSPCGGTPGRPSGRPGGPSGRSRGDGPPRPRPR